MSVRVLVIIPVADRDGANAAAAQYFDAQGGASTFRQGLSASGAAPATHYWASAQFSLQNFEVLQGVASAFPAAELLVYDLFGDPGRPYVRVAELGLQLVREAL